MSGILSDRREDRRAGSTYDLVQDSLEGGGNGNLRQLPVLDDGDLPLLNSGGGNGERGKEGKGKGERLEELHCGVWLL